MNITDTGRKLRSRLKTSGSAKAKWGTKLSCTKSTASIYARHANRAIEILIILITEGDEYGDK